MHGPNQDSHGKHVSRNCPGLGGSWCSHCPMLIPQTTTHTFKIALLPSSSYIRETLHITRQAMVRLLAGELAVFICGYCMASLAKLARQQFWKSYSRRAARTLYKKVPTPLTRQHGACLLEADYPYQPMNERALVHIGTHQKNVPPPCFMRAIA